MMTMPVTLEAVAKDDVAAVTEVGAVTAFRSGRTSICSPGTAPVYKAASRRIDGKNILPKHRAYGLCMNSRNSPRVVEYERDATVVTPLGPQV